MQQLTQKLKNGETKVIEVPAPQVGPEMVLVRNHFSVISAGTEGMTANSARKSLLAKAKERPEQVRQVWEVVRKSGPLAAYRAVTKKLEAYSPCGYSSAGVVVAAGTRVSGFAPGDKVACAGVGYANHAELVSVPVNLCVKLDPGADLMAAAYNTLGAIAMQGVRQADVRLGENVLVIGLGLLGQLTAQLLRASGCRVVGVDVASETVKRCVAHVDLALQRGDAGIEGKILRFSNGDGMDAVIITAATSSLDPVNFAGRMARRKASVVVVGAVPTGFERDIYYKKELTLKMSCSYGPGRYDLDYEEKGIDYPVEYVRWTEGRNMEAFQQLLLEKKIDVHALTSHRFPFDRAPEAYDMIVTRSEPFTGIILEYDVGQPCRTENIRAASETAVAVPDAAGVAFIGAGNYAQGSLLPNMPRDPAIRRMGIMTNSGTTSRRVMERFGFNFCTDKEQDILENPEITTVFIATRHDSHAVYTEKALRHGKHVFVEKPLALTVGELQMVEAAWKAGNRQLLVGFNRRFAPLARRLKREMGTGTMSMLYRISAGAIPSNNWIQDLELGGGRVIGEGCHFLDFMSWMCGSVPVTVYASALPDPQNLNDTVNINVEFANGSTGVVAYYANASKGMAKEYFEVHHSGTSGVLTDFRRLEIFGRQTFRQKTWGQDKGQASMMAEFLQSIRTGGAPLIPFAELKAVSLAALAAVESIREKAPIRILE